MSAKYTSMFTVWTAGARDVRSGDTSYGSPTVFKGLFKQGGNLKLVDKTGQEFHPKSTFWTALEVVTGSLTTIRNDDLIMFGDHRSVTDPLTVSAQQVRGQTIFDNSMFGQSSDYVYGTM